MKNMHYRGKQVTVFLSTLLATIPAFAYQLDPSNVFGTIFNPNCSKVVFQVGGFWATQGRAQNIKIVDLIGDRFTTTRRHDESALLGIGYYINGLQDQRYQLMYGLNAFYLGATSVKGNVVQEHLFTNLSYRYSITNYPIYLAAKAIINMNDARYNVTLDLGVGPNILNNHGFRERSLDGGVTSPDHIFSGKTDAAFSTTAGVGVKFNNVLGCLPLEVGYRFFYLGEGKFKKDSNQIRTTLKTGQSYANALVATISI